MSQVEVPDPERQGDTLQLGHVEYVACACLEWRDSANVHWVNGDPWCDDCLPADEEE